MEGGGWIAYYVGRAAGGGSDSCEHSHSHSDSQRGSPCLVTLLAVSCRVWRCTQYSMVMLAQTLEGLRRYSIVIGLHPSLWHQV